MQFARFVIIDSSDSGTIGAESLLGEWNGRASALDHGDEAAQFVHGLSPARITSGVRSDLRKDLGALPVVLLLRDEAGIE